MKYIRWFAEIGEHDFQAVGGKGANLGILYRAGLPVPDGFCVTTQAYRDFVEARALGETLARLEASVKVEDVEALEQAAARIRALFTVEGMLGPGEPLAALAEELRAAQAELDRRSGGRAVAVRSSATVEDLPDLSFAGQQDTYLNVRGSEQLFEAVVRCWASLWTARAMGYRARNGISGSAAALAVVVQSMVESESAGVLFTANPLTGRRGQAVIDATLGLGEALVGGQVEPDHYVVDASAGRILSKQLGAKALSIRPAQEGGVRRQAEQAGETQALSDAQIIALARLGRQVENLFGSPQDIEWAVEDGRLYLLQSRPITSLYPLPERLSPDGPLKVLFSFASVQGILDPMTPLGRDTIAMIAAAVARIFGQNVDYETQFALFTAGERLFINLTGVLRNPTGRRMVRAAMGAIDPVVQEVFAELLQDPRLELQDEMRPITRLRLARAVGIVGSGVVLNLLFPAARRQRLNRRVEAMITAIERECAQSQGTAGLVESFVASFKGLPGFFLGDLLPIVAAGQAVFQPLLRLASDLPGGRALVMEISRGNRYNVTTEMDLALWDTAVQIRADEPSARHFAACEAGELARQYLEGRLPEAAQMALNCFLWKYGMRGLGEIDLGRERWREDPTPLMQTIKSYLVIKDEERSPRAVFERGAKRSLEAEEQLARAVRAGRWGWLKAWYVHWAASRVRELTGLRETPKFTAIRAMGVWRKQLLASGRQWAQEGVIERAEDLFFLHLKELQALAKGEARDWKALIAARRAVYEREKRRRQVPRLLLSDGTAYYERSSAHPTAASAQVLRGSPVSPGVVEGRARVVHDPRGTQLLPGEILVCPATDPSWTPLFLSAGGLVMEMGGMMTHGSVVAREYGIPAVVGVSYATQQITTGQRLRVDGSLGVVELLSQDEDQ